MRAYGGVLISCRVDWVPDSPDRWRDKLAKLGRFASPAADGCGTTSARLPLALRALSRDTAGLHASPQVVTPPFIVSLFASSGFLTFSLTVGGATCRMMANAILPDLAAVLLQADGSDTR